MMKHYKQFQSNNIMESTTDYDDQFVMEQNISFDYQMEDTNMTQDDIQFQQDLAILMTIGTYSSEPIKECPLLWLANINIIELLCSDNACAPSAVPRSNSVLLDNNSG